MKTKMNVCSKLAVILTIGFFMSLNQIVLAQDTLHIYYQGLQTKILDSNDAKISKWVKSLNGRKVQIEIYSYYEKGEFKKYMTERTDELFMVVNRKARDFITVKFMGAVKGKKSQRSVADLVYTIDGVPSSNSNASTISPKKEKDASTKPNKKEKEEKEEEKNEVAEKNENTNSGTKEEEKEVKEKKVEKSKKDLPKPGYVYDTTYVNGKAKITKTKIKNK